MIEWIIHWIKSRFYSCPKKLIVTTEPWWAGGNTFDKRKIIHMVDTIEEFKALPHNKGEWGYAVYIDYYGVVRFAGHGCIEMSDPRIDDEVSAGM